MIALLIGILGIANTMAMSVFERTREIGILRALGWNRRQVLILIQLEAVVLGLGGGFLGIALGWCALRVLAALPQTASIVSTSVPWELLAEALGIAVIAGLIAGLVACYRGLTVSRGGAKAVGNAVNETVVYAFMALFVINVVVTAIGIRFTTK